MGRIVGGTVMKAPINAPKLYDCRDAFASTRERLAAENETIVAVCN
ncbi:transketolase family protein, partial [Rhizobium leguminosarum]